MITHKYDDFFIGDTPPKDYTCMAGYAKNGAEYISI